MSRLEEKGEKFWDEIYQIAGKHTVGIPVQQGREDININKNSKNSSFEDVSDVRYRTFFDTHSFNVPVSYTIAFKESRGRTNFSVKANRYKGSPNYLTFNLSQFYSLDQKITLRLPIFHTA